MTNTGTGDGFGAVLRRRRADHGRSRRAHRRGPGPSRIWQISSREESLKAGIEGEQQVASRLGRGPIQRVVLLTHPRSRLGTHRNPTVSIATSTGDVISLLNDSQTTLDPPQLRWVEDLIVRDHQFHQSRRGPWR